MPYVFLRGGINYSPLVYCPCSFSMSEHYCHLYRLPCLLLSVLSSLFKGPDPAVRPSAQVGVWQALTLTHLPIDKVLTVVCCSVFSVWSRIFSSASWKLYIKYSRLLISQYINHCFVLDERDTCIYEYIARNEYFRLFVFTNMNKETKFKSGSKVIPVYHVFGVNVHMLFWTRCYISSLNYCYIVWISNKMLNDMTQNR